MSRASRRVVPGSTEDRIADSDHDVGAVLTHGEDVPADGVPARFVVTVSLVSRPEIFCWVLTGRRSRSAWFDVGDSQVGGDPQDVGFAVAEVFQQRPAFWLFTAGRTGDLGQSEADVVG